jgi:aryl-alcohol dehydrogenase-like predicted oxidoreductase
MMQLPDESTVPFASDFEICRILNGMWQVSGSHGAISQEDAIQDMFKYLDAGYTTWDLADHYGPAEDFVGQFRRELRKSRGAASLNGLHAFTKWVPRPAPMTRQVVRDRISISLRRMDVDTLDLLQFHWWDYDNAGYLDALTYLAELQTEGRIKHLGLTNFDTAHLKLILEHGISVVSNQVQFSLIDRRPDVQMLAVCEAYGVQLLTYGTVCGGLLSERYLGQPEPMNQALNTASLQKYTRIIRAWGGWALFQQLLATLNQVGEKHGVGIAAVAIRYILDRPAVAGVIIGARLGASNHREENSMVFALSIDADDLDAIEVVLKQSHDLYQLIGDCGDEYRH